MMLFKRPSAGYLDHIKYLQKSHDKYDSILKMVISTMHKLKWRDVYGLSITDTMNLEFGEFDLMRSELENILTDDINLK